MSSGGTIDHDVIVVGAGHNGLICAAYLARAGKNTLLVEARDTVGGCASTVDAVGARVNICNCDHVSVRSMPIFDELGLDDHGLSYLDLDCTQVAISWGEDRPAISFHDRERTLDALALTHPFQVAGFNRFLDQAIPAAELIMEMAQQPPSASGMTQRVLRRGGKGASTILKWSRMTAAQVLEQFLSSDTMIGAALGTGPTVWGVPPRTLGTGLGALSPAMKMVARPGRPVGGSGALPDAVRSSFEAAGGTVRTSSPVAALLIEDETVVGVELVDGTQFRADQVVVASDPTTALLRWVTNPPASVTSFLDSWRARPTLDGYESKIDAVVTERPRLRHLDSRVVDTLGIDPLEPTVVIAPGVAGIESAHATSVAGGVADQPVMFLNVPSVRDETMRAPNGGHVVSLEVLYTPYALTGGWPGSSEPERWLGRLAEHLEPGFLESIVDWRAMTPDKYESDFGMPRGYAQSFAGGPLAALLGKDPELSRYRTPLGGLYLTGAATFPGAGIWGASGRNAAHAVLTDV